MTTPGQRKALEEALYIQSELLSRQKDDPLSGFEPNQGGQQDFIFSVLGHEYKENWFLAANRAGKSDAGAYCGASLARFGDQSDRVRMVHSQGVGIRDRATSGWVVSLDFPSSRDIVQPKYFDNGYVPPGASHMPFIPLHEYEKGGWSVSNQTIRLKNGSIIGFKSADSGRVKFQGTEKDWVHFDEEPPEGIYEEVIIRVGARPLNIFGTCTLLPPEGQVGGVTWVYSKKVRPWRRGSFKDNEVGVFSASIYENPFISRTEITRLEALYPIGSLQRRIRLNGELIAGTAGARIYGSFINTLNVSPQGDMSLRRPLCWMWDFNIEPMVTLLGQHYQGIFHVHRELMLPEGNIAEMCGYFREVHPMHQAEVWVYGDASGRDRSHQSKRTSYQLILNELSGYSAPLRLKVPERNPAVTDRVNAVNRACKDEEGMNRLLIDPDCEELIADLEQVLADGRGQIRKTYNKKDPYFHRTHMSDALGYWITQVAPIQPIGTEDVRPRSIKIKRAGYRSGQQLIQPRRA